MSNFKKSNYNKYIFNKNINTIQNYYGVSEECSIYLYYRALKGKKENLLKWNLQLQNAMIELDKSKGIIWKKIKFGNELNILKKNGIVLEKVDNSKVFKSPDFSLIDENNNDGWTTVISKKKKKQIKYYNGELEHIKNLGLII